MQMKTFRSSVRLYASPNNPGATAVANDLSKGMGGAISVASDVASATHFLLYLNDQAYLKDEGVKLANELRAAHGKESAVKVVMVHENDDARGGCEFSLFFQGRTPQDLMHGGIYNDLALALYSGPFWPVSVALVAGVLGAADARLWGSKFSTVKATRSPVQGDAEAPRLDAGEQAPLSDIDREVAKLEAEAAQLRAEIAQDSAAVPSPAVVIAAASGPPSAATSGAGPSGTPLRSSKSKRDVAESEELRAALAAGDAENPVYLKDRPRRESLRGASKRRSSKSTKQEWGLLTGTLRALGGHIHRSAASEPTKSPMPRQKTLPKPWGKTQVPVSQEEAGPSGAGPSDAANEADAVVEDAPSAPEHDYNAPKNHQPRAVKDTALGTLEA